jgi:alpha-N-acetylglucosaminidase
MLILDIGNDRYPGIWQKTDAFNGKAWAYGYVHNYGGSNPVYGDLEFYRRDMAVLHANPRKGSLTGFGLFPEGLHSNSVVYDYAYDLAWGEPDRPVAEWLSEHLKARYGEASPALAKAWEQAAAGAYRTRYWEPRWWQQHAGAYLFFKRPMAAGGDYPEAPGDPTKLRQGIVAMLAATPSSPAPLLVYDIVDLTRHHASLELDRLLKASIVAYRDGKLAEGDRARARMAALARRIDLLAGNQQETLGSWVADARAYGDTLAEKSRFAEEAKALVTVWGGQGHLSDYASRAWQGLYAGYYLPRWESFLTAQRAAAASGKALDEPATLVAVQAWEQQWITDGRAWKRQKPRNPLKLVREILAETRP